MSQNTPLSARYYVDPDYFEVDKEKVFYRTWQCVCHVSEIANAGDFKAFTIADENIFVIRAKDGTLYAYYNVCCHRGHPLVEGSGSGKRVLVCPYHAWTYELNGKLRRAPGSVESDGLTPDQINLRKIQVEVFCGFIFVNLDENAAPMGPVLEEYRENILSFHADPTQLKFVCETEIEHQSNWKLSVENYNECYHCPTVHGSSLTQGVLDMEGYTTIPHGMTIWHDGKAQTKNEKQYNYDLEASPRAGDYGAYWIWPNVSMCCYPGGYFTIRQWLPIAWNRTIYRYRWFSSGDISDDEVRTLMIKHKETTGAEDEVVVSKIQKGMQSRTFTPGPYVIGDGCGAKSEVGLLHFHNLYRHALGEPD
ncbi:MAG: phenylpropionate dioxygenase-like ring-hydroxylating dioxygenase large terminal subunit [Parasphingorhabdus sp.]|jgi:phenylpropionate dioxygenase-like ring-hydroxylating dioxygenase large terminal subunit